MNPDYWHRQTSGKPLFPDLAWSRPENRNTAGKLLVIGGNLHGFAAPAAAYAESLRAGVGTCKVLLPSAVRKTVGNYLDNGEFAPSTPSGSFARAAIAELLSFSSWADGVLFAGDLGRNSETAVAVEQFLQKSAVPAVLTKDAADYVISAPRNHLARPATCLVISLSQLQRLAIAVRYAKAVTFSMNLIHLAEWLHEFTGRYTPAIVVKHHDYILVGIGGDVSTTKLAADSEIWRVKTAAHLAVWWIQNKSKPFEAITAALYDLYCKE